MPTHRPKDGGISAADVDAKLPRGYFVKRGAIMEAFGLTRDDWDALVPDTFHPAVSKKFKYHRFVRAQVVDVARRWEREGRGA